MTRWSIREFHGEDGLAALEPDWRLLVRAMPDRAMHHAFEFHRAHARHCATGNAVPTYFALARDEAVRAIVPLEPGTDRILGRTVPVWQLPLGIANVHRDFIAAPDTEVRRALIRTLVVHLRGRGGAARWLALERLRDTSVAWSALRHASRWSTATAPSASMDEIDCARPYAEVAASRGRNFRHALRKARNKLDALGDVRFENACTAADVTVALATFLALEASGWKGGAGERTAIVFRPQLDAFIRDVATMSDGTDRAEINLLHAGERCVAAQFCIRTGAEYAVYKIAFDERASHASPGQVLLDWLLQRCCDDPTVERINLVSHAPWHAIWQPRVVPMHAAYISLHRGFSAALGSLLRFRLRSRAPTDQPTSGPPPAGAQDRAS